MAALGSTSGASFVPDLTQALNVALQTFGTPEIREARQLEADTRQAEIDKQKSIDQQLGILIPAPGDDPGATRGDEQAAILRLISLDPVLGGAVRDTIAAGDDEAQEVLRLKAEEGARNAAFIAKQPDFASKQRAITVLAEDAAARGEPLDKFIEMQNMDEDRLGLELQRQQIAAQDIKTVLTPAGQFAPVTDADGNIIGQMNLETGRVVEDPRAVEPTKPLTAIAKARADLKANLITQEDFNIINSTPKKFQSDVGKLLEDQKLAIEMFGPDSNPAKAIAEAIASKNKGEGPKLTDIAGIRKEFTGLSSDFIKLRDAIGKVEQATLDPSAAGDLALIFNFMKILDPGSVVRESEFATAQNAAGVPQRIRAQFNRVLSGERLGDVQRTDFADTANRLFASQTEKQTALEESFRNIAINTGIDPEDVIIDFIGDVRPVEEIVDTPGPVIQEGATATNPETQEKLIFRNGQWQSL